MVLTSTGLEIEWLEGRSEKALKKVGRNLLSKTISENIENNGTEERVFSNLPKPIVVAAGWNSQLEYIEWSTG